MDDTTTDLLQQAEQAITQARSAAQRSMNSPIPEYYAPLGSLVTIMHALCEFLDTSSNTLARLNPDDYYDSEGDNPGESYELAGIALRSAKNCFQAALVDVNTAWTHLGRLEHREAEGEHAHGASDTEKIDHHIRSLPIPAQGGYPLISDAAARMIASTYHSGQNSLGYSFVATGAIPVDPAELWRELFHDTWHDMSEHYRTIADHLGVYLHTHGPRGPLPHWHTLWL